MQSVKRECYKLIQMLVVRGACRYPGCRRKAVVGHHLFKRDRMATAFLPDAILALCHEHHLEAHRCPEAFKSIAEYLLGSAKYLELESMSRMLVRYRQEDYEAIREALRRVIMGD